MNKKVFKYAVFNLRIWLCGKTRPEKYISDRKVGNGDKTHALKHANSTKRGY